MPDAFFVHDYALAMRQTLWKITLVGNPVTRIYQTAHPFSLVEVVVALVNDAVLEWIYSVPVLKSILEVSLVNSSWLDQLPFSMKFSPFTEWALISVVIFALLPLKPPIGLKSLGILSYEHVSVSFFLSFSVEEIVAKSSYILQIWGFISSLRSFCFIFNKLSLKKGSVREDIGSSTICFSIFEVPYKERPIFFIKLSKPMRSVLHKKLHYLWNVTFVDFSPVFFDDRSISFGGKKEI